MVKKGISFILFYFYFVSSYANEAAQQVDHQAYLNGRSADVWSILGYILFGGTVVYLAIAYLNNRKRKQLEQEVTKIEMGSELKNEKASLSHNRNVTDIAQVVKISDGISEKKSLQTNVDMTVLNVDRSNFMHTSSSSGKCKILIIEDHKDIRLYLKLLFTGEYDLIMAENGEEGLKLARRELPDLVITDVMMPMMNGFECCKRIKEDIKTCHIPVIVLTALVGDEDVVKGIDLGADDYVLKPFSPEILKSKVKRLIKTRQDLKHIYTRLLTPVDNVSEDKVKVEDEVKAEDPFIAQIVHIVENNMHYSDFSVKRLSEMLNMSQPTLYRRVKLLTNFTIIEFVRGIRLKRSAELIKSRQYNVQEVAELVGYNDVPTFRKHFVDFYGTTPSTFGRED